MVWAELGQAESTMPRGLLIPLLQTGAGRMHVPYPEIFHDPCINDIATI